MCVSFAGVYISSTTAIQFILMHSSLGKLHKDRWRNHSQSRSFYSPLNINSCLSHHFINDVVNSLTVSEGHFTALQISCFKTCLDTVCLIPQTPTVGKVVWHWTTGYFIGYFTWRQICWVWGPERFINLYFSLWTIYYCWILSLKQCTVDKHCFTAILVG